MKNVYVLEVLRPVSYFEDMLSSFDERVNNCTAVFRHKFGKMYTEVREEISSKLLEAKRDGGVWEGLIGNASVEEFVKEGYSVWSNTAGDDFRVVTGVIDEGADTWVEYQNPEVMELLTDMIIDDYIGKFAEECVKDV